jgi:ubiquitin-protein ligase
MIEGFDVDLDVNRNVRQVNDTLLPILQSKSRVSGPPQLQIYLPSVIPFLSGTLREFFNVPVCANACHILYVVVTRPIADALLTREMNELCDASTEDRKLLLAPVVPLSEVSYSHFACLLGYLGHDGMKGDPFMKVIATFTGFAPLISGLWRMVENHPVLGRDVAAVSAALYGFYSSLLPSTLPPEKVFEYVLRCSAFVFEGLSSTKKERISLPIRKVEVDSHSADPLHRYLTATKQPKTVLMWKVDLDPAIEFDRKKQEQPRNQFAIANAWRFVSSFRPLSPLSLWTITGASIVEYLNGNTALFLSENCLKDHATAQKVDLLDPLTGRSTATDLEALAKQLESRESDGMQLIDSDKVRQVIQVCFDSSSSMGCDLAGWQCNVGRGDVMRVTIAAQYLTIFANRTYGFRLPCVQGLIAFNDKQVVKCPLSPLVPDFEEGIGKVVPSSTPKLWDALKKAADDLVAYASPDGKARFPSAELRILVMSAAEDVGSSTTPLQALQAMMAAKIVCDAVIISSVDQCRTLCAVCHLTGGLAFRPQSVADGLRIFEQEAFLCYEQRKTPVRFCGTLSDQTIKDRAAADPFDTVAESSTTATATGKEPIAVPRYILFQNRSQEIPDPGRRRILRELHHAAAVQDPHSVGHDPDGNEVSIFDADLRIYPFRAHFDQWRVYVKGIEGTPYGGKWWYIYVTFPDEFPALPPMFRFISVPYHINVSLEGRICLEIIEKGYTPKLTAVELIQSIKQLFVMPDTSTPLDIVKWLQYKGNRREYDRLALESARRFAKDTADEWIADLCVERDVPDDFSIEIGEQIPRDSRTVADPKFIPKERREVSKGGLVSNLADLLQLKADADVPRCQITGRPLTDIDDLLLI